MNIFVLDTDPIKCAEYHCNKHVVKMILETAQLLCGVHHMTKLEEQREEIPYKLSHKNHPCSIWARECIENYVWLCDLGMALCEEYTHRYGKKHKSVEILEWCVANKPKIVDIGFTEPPKAMPNEYKVDCVIKSYRNYYRGAKVNFATWKHRNIPDWFFEKN